MFSHRTNWQLAQNRLTSALERVRARKLKIVDLTISNPTRAGLQYDERAILAALADPRALDYDPQAKGLLAAREAVAAYYRTEHGLELDAEDIVLTASTSEGYSYVFRLLCNGGDELLVPKPSYPLFEFLADLQDVRLVPYPLIYDHGWQMDFHSLEKAVTARTRGVVLVHPNNPTGSFVSAGEREQLNAFCRERGLAVVVDEVFLDYGINLGASNAHVATAAPGCRVERSSTAVRIQDTSPHGLKPEHLAGAPLPEISSGPGTVELRSTGQPGAAVPTRSFAANRNVLTFTLSGLSKISALPQMKVAWVVTSGPDEIVRDAMARLEVIADTYLSMNAPVQWAMPVLLEQRRDIQRQLMARVRTNLAELDRQLARQTACERLEVQAGWYAVLRVPVTRSDEELAIALVEEKQVLVHPGHFYDFPGDGCLVVSLIGAEQEFRQGVSAVLTYLV